MAEIKQVGVLGAGLMGHGIAQVAAQAGYEVVLREVDEADARQGRGQDREAARARGREGQVHAGGRRRGARAHQRHGRLRRPRPVRPRDRGDHREPRAEARDVARARSDRQARGRVRHEHLLAVGDRPGGRHRAPAAVRGAALLQPRAGHEARGGSPLCDYLGRGLRDRAPVRAQRGQARDPHARSRGVHRQPPARAVHARRDPRLRRGRGLGRARSTRR